jgi:hypothetical protein
MGGQKDLRKEKTMDEEKLTKSQETEEILLAKIDEANASDAKAWGETYAKIKEADVKESTSMAEWNKICMEDEREKKKLEIEAQKVANEHEIKKAEILNERIQTGWNIGSAIGGAVAGIGLLDLMTKVTMLMEKEGLYPSSLFSKETMNLLSKKAGEFIVKGIFRR